MPVNVFTCGKCSTFRFFSNKTSPKPRVIEYKHIFVNSVHIRNSSSEIHPIKLNLVLFLPKWASIEKAPDSKVYGANMGPTWVLSSPCGPHVGPMNFAIRGRLSIQDIKSSKVSRRDVLNTSGEYSSHINLAHIIGNKPVQDGKYFY